MKKDRLLRVNELLRRGIGEILFSVIHENAVDLSGITVTHVMASKDMAMARVLISVREETQRSRVMALLQRHRAQIQEELAHKVILKRTPRLLFVSDTSLAEGDRVLQVLARMESAPPEPPPGEDHAHSGS
jgi:ribosome-binding factor A